MEFQDHHQGEPRLNIVLTLLIGLLNFGSWALKEIADRIRGASSDAQIGIMLLTIALTLAGAIGMVVMFVSAISGSNESATVTPATPTLSRPAAVTEPAALTPISTIAPTIATPAVAPTLDPLEEIVGRISDLKTGIAEKKAEIREARKTAKEDVPDLQQELRDLEAELKETEAERKTLRAGKQ